jgi:hypothetical protein
MITIPTKNVIMSPRTSWMIFLRKVGLSYHAEVLGDVVWADDVAENGFTPDEMDVLTYQLKEEGLVNFLRGYVTSQATPDGEIPVSSNWINTQSP